jgi:hypothetical protein
MRCPTCLYEGTPHVVETIGAPVSDKLPPVEFWDAMEHHHVHDASVRSGGFQCSHGHQWRVESITRCPQFHCSWNLRPVARAQLDVQIPGVSARETMAEFRARKISQFIRLKKRLPSLRMEESGLFFCTFTAIEDGDPTARIEFGSIPVERKDRMFIDRTDSEVVDYFNGASNG